MALNGATDVRADFRASPPARCRVGMSLLGRPSRIACAQASRARERSRSLRVRER
jgi:hypothetical protein